MLKRFKIYFKRRSGWVSVKEKLPSENEVVLVQYGYFCFYLVTYLVHINGLKWAHLDEEYQDKVTHWMYIVGPF